MCIDEITILDVAHKTLSLTNVLVSLSRKIDDSPITSQDILYSLKDMVSKLDRINRILHMQMLQPLKSGLSILADAEMEYPFNPSNGKQLAQMALNNFNKAEGLCPSDENKLLVFIGKACAFKLLGMIGAYRRAPEDANRTHLLFI